MTAIPSKRCLKPAAYMITSNPKINSNQEGVIRDIVCEDCFMNRSYPKVHYKEYKDGRCKRQISIPGAIAPPPPVRTPFPEWTERLREYQAQQKKLRDNNELDWTMGHFHKEMVDKFVRKAKEHNRSLDPWLDYGTQFLGERLFEEWEELYEEFVDVSGNSDKPIFKLNEKAADELIDVANFCMFLWLRWKYGDRLND